MNALHPGVQTAVSVVQYAVLLRIPILVALALLALPFLALRTGARSMLAGLFDVSPLSFFFVTLAALTASWTVMATSSIILDLAYLRMNVPRLGLDLRQHGPLCGFLFGLLAAPVLLGVIARSPGRRLRLAASAFLGTALMALAYAVGLYVQARYVAGSGAPQGLLTDSPGWRSWMRTLDHSGLFAGYFQPGGEPFPAHLTGLLILGLTLSLYGLLGWIGGRRLGGRMVPALTSLLFLFVLLGWGLSGLTFFFDAFRVPLLLILALSAAFSAQFQLSDHFFHVLLAPPDRPPAPRPEEVARAGGSDTMIVVAANGGGIQAAAWTARVLAGLEKDCRRELGDGRFGESIRFVSAVSGGSVGAMYFVDAYPEIRDARTRDARLDQVVADAMSSSLDAVAWGLVYPDFWRLVVPPFVRRLMGRGRALEKAWERPGTGVGGPLSAWREDARRGERPAVVFNATLAEVGCRFLFTTSELDHGVKGSHEGRLSFGEHYPGHDLAVVTAARLSAAFPYVTPAARANLPGDQPHVVDGGYFDNYGMTTLVEWLDAALRKSGGAIRRVLVLQIRGAKVADVERAQARRIVPRGWFYQAFAPIATLFSVRGVGQISHNETEYGLLERVWEGTGKVDLSSVVFEFPGDNPPLSWHLTDEQKAAIESAWAGPGLAACRKQVIDFLRS